MKIVQEIIIKQVIWRYVCDNCNLQMDHVDDGLPTVPGWQREVDYSGASGIYPNIRDICPVCVEKKEIRQVFT